MTTRVKKATPKVIAVYGLLNASYDVFEREDLTKAESELAKKILEYCEALNALVSP